jgi:hypothetical protein
MHCHRNPDLIEGPGDVEAIDRLRQGESIGRPVGSPDFLAQVEALTARRLQPRKRGPKPARTDEPRMRG